MKNSHRVIKNILFIGTLVKAGVAGAGAGLALLGAADLAMAATALQWVDSIKPQFLINIFAISGGTLAICAHIFYSIWG